MFTIILFCFFSFEQYTILFFLLLLKIKITLLNFIQISKCHIIYIMSDFVFKSIFAAVVQNWSTKTQKAQTKAIGYEISEVMPR